MPSLTIKFAGTTKKFTINNANSFVKQTEDFEHLQTYFSGQDTTINVKNKKEYDDLTGFLTRADADKNGRIDREDYMLLRETQEKNDEKFDPLCFGEGGDGYDAISGQSKNGGFYSIFIH